jgi:acetylornithine deacetylase/succinyl-diaminopimelate desuccinylase-like protein
MFGGAVLNPANELARLISGMHDENGHITLPGFYDKVRPLSDEERAELARLPIDDNFFLDATGAPSLWGEAGFTPEERVGARPTLDVNGMLSGFTGEGSKTVLPAKALAKISTRLVPDQDPKDVYKSLCQYLEDNARPGVTWEVVELAGGPASITPRDSIGVKAMSDGMESVWGKRPVFKLEGGSVPVVAQMEEILGIDTVMSGFGLPDDNLHAPNEKLTLAPWYKGIDALIHFFHNLGS